MAPRGEVLATVPKKVVFFSPLERFSADSTLMNRGTLC